MELDWQQSTSGQTVYDLKSGGLTMDNFTDSSTLKRLFAKATASTKTAS
jgi:hypothetical protein